MNLEKLLKNKKFTESKISIKGLSEDSRKIKKNYIFFLKNTNTKSEKYLAEAVNNGASLVIHNKTISFDIKKYTNKCILHGVSCVTSKMAEISKKYYGHNPKQIKIYGVTGTNGKSSVANYIAQLKTINKEKCATIGTIGAGIYPNLKKQSLTTPITIEIIKKIAGFEKKKIKNLSLEVSSHGIAQKRISGIQFESVIFTNLSQDHLDYHKSMKNYFYTKLSLFIDYKNKKKIICVDDIYGKKLKEYLSKKKLVRTVSVKDSNSDYYASKIKFSESGTEFILNSKYGSKNIKTKLYGIFTVSNIISSIAAIVNSKKDYNTYTKNIPKLKPIDGRMNRYHKKDFPNVFIDFAHSPDSIKKVMQSIKLHYPDKKIITIFGCGGERDTGKRKIMGGIVSKYSSDIILTNDNPRNEDPKKIVTDIVKGFNPSCSYKIIFDRKKAIRKYVNKTNKEKIVLILGKGHENFQVFKDKSIFFSDKREVQKILK